MNKKDTMFQSIQTLSRPEQDNLIISSFHGKEKQLQLTIKQLVAKDPIPIEDLLNKTQQLINDLDETNATYLNNILKRIRGLKAVLTKLKQNIQLNQIALNKKDSHT
jgi:hypothetical protein